MDLDDMRRIAQTMAENGLHPGLVTDDFEYTIEAHPSSHPAAGRPHPASEILRRARARQGGSLFRLHPAPEPRAGTAGGARPDRTGLAAERVSRMGQDHHPLPPRFQMFMVAIALI